MKKWSYIICGFLLGVAVASSAGSVAAKVQSLVGEKVTAELTVVVNGQELLDKGAVVKGRTNAPVRAIAEALGGEVSLENNKVIIKTNAENISNTSNESSDKTVILDGRYYTKLELINKKQSLEKGIESAKQEYEDVSAKYQELQSSGKLEGQMIWDVRLKNSQEAVERNLLALDQVNEALKQFN